MEQGIDDVRLLTADQCQGLQANVVIFDTVRTRTPGFMKGHNPEQYGDRQNGRLVIAMTRARKLRIVIGNSTNMETNSDMVYVANIHRQNGNGLYLMPL